MSNATDPIGPNMEPDEPKSVLKAGLARIDDRQQGYGASKRENAFPFIAERWQVWLRQHFGPRMAVHLKLHGTACEKAAIDTILSLTEADVADMMIEFKRGRRAARLAAGKGVRFDDLVDEAGYIEWVGHFLSEQDGNGE